MKVYVVWKGHRDYEENVAVCETELIAKGVLTRNGVEMRCVPGWPDRPEMMDVELTPWGIEAVDFIGRKGTGVGAKVRSTDPTTSRLAFLSNQPRAGTQRAKLLEAVKSARFDGMTAEQAATAAGIRLNSASTRMSELMRGGHIVESTTLTRKTSGGDRAIVYLAKEI